MPAPAVARHGPRLTGRTRATIGAVAVLGGLFLVAFATASDQTYDIGTRHTPYRGVEPATREGPLSSAIPGFGLPVDDVEGPPPAWIGRDLQLFLGVGLLALAGLVVWYVVGVVRSRDWSRPRGVGRSGDDVESAPADVRRALAASVDEVLDQLEQGETRNAIIGCWLRLEEAAASAGVSRRPTETAGDLTERVLAMHRVDARKLTRLADLYREARFSSHALGEPARVEARSALQSVRDDLTAASGT
jgi:hypothetical protein